MPPRNIEPQEPASGYFSYLPEEIILNLFGYFTPDMFYQLARVNSLFYALAMDPSQWKRKLAQHFPHVYAELIKQENVLWQIEFEKTYKKEYTCTKLLINDETKNALLLKEGELLPKFIRRPFTLVKEGDLAALQNLQFEKYQYFCTYLTDITDSNDCSLIDWAYRLKHQHLLDYFYEKIELKVDEHKRARVHWAVLCHQPPEALNRRLTLTGMMARDNNHESALHYAARLGNEEMMDYLCTTIDVNKANKFGETALFIATAHRKPNVVKKLLEQNRVNLNTPLKFRNKFHEKHAIYVDYTPLHVAARLGDSEIATLLLDSCASPNTLAPSNGHTALIVAAFAGHSKLVRLFIQRKANVNAQTNHGATSLLYAVERNDKETIGILLENSADASLPLRVASDSHKRFYAAPGDTPIHIAAKLGFIEVVTQLLDHGISVDILGNGGKTPCMEAAKVGRVEVVKLLLNRGADVNAQDQDGATALFYAAEYKHGEVVDVLLSYEADTTLVLHTTNKEHMSLEVYEGATPLHATITPNRPGFAFKIVASLIKYGVDIEAKTAEGWTPLRLAALQGTPDVVEYLLAQGADVNEFNPRRGATALMIATLYNKASVASILLSYNADSSLALRHGFPFYTKKNVFPDDNPLHVAVKQRFTAIIDLLLDHQAPLETFGSTKETPLMIAARLGYDDIAERLLQSGANIDTQTENGITALISAIREGHSNVVKVLLQYNPDLRLKLKNKTLFEEKAGDSALHIAAHLGHMDIVRQLIKKKADINITNAKGKTPIDCAPKKLRLEMKLLCFSRAVKERTASEQNETNPKYVSVFGIGLFGSKYNDKQLLPAAKALKKVIYDDVDRRELDQYSDQLLNSKFKLLYKQIKRRC